MNKAQYENERTVRLRDLLITICQRWRVLIICFIIGAVVLGAIGWLKGKNDAITTPEKAEAVAASIGSRRAGVLQSYAVDIKNSTEQLIWQGNYNNTALIMQLDPFHLFVHELRYVISGEEADNSDSLRLTFVQAYVSELQEDYLDQKLNTVVEDGAGGKQRELYESPGLIEVFENYQGTGIIRFLLYFAAEEDAPAAVSALKNEMQAVQGIVQNKYGEHVLSLAGESSFEYGDLEILQIQEANSQKINDLNDRITRLRDAVKDPRENEYMNYWIDYAGNDASGNQSALQYLNKKMIVAGAGLGLVLAVLVILLKYLLTDTIKNDKEIEETYGIPLLGKLNGTQSFYRKRKTKLDQWLRKKKNQISDNKSQDEIEELAVTRILIEAEKRGIHSIAMIIDNNAVQNADLLTNIEKKLGQSLQVQVIRDVFEKPDSLKTLAETDGAVLFAQVDGSKNDDIRKTAAICEVYKVQLIGNIIAE